MADLTIGEAFGWLAERLPEAAALRLGDEVWSRRDLEDATNRIARGWRRGGLAPDAVVAIAVGDPLEVVLACVAAWKAGATPLPLRVTGAEREPVLQLARRIGCSWSLGSAGAAR